MTVRAGPKRLFSIPRDSTSPKADISTWLEPDIFMWLLQVIDRRDRLRNLTALRAIPRRPPSGGITPLVDGSPFVRHRPSMAEAEAEAEAEEGKEAFLVLGERGHSDNLHAPRVPTALSRAKKATSWRGTLLI